MKSIVRVKKSRTAVLTVEDKYFWRTSWRKAYIAMWTVNMKKAGEKYERAFMKLR